MSRFTDQRFCLSSLVERETQLLMSAHLLLRNGIGTGSASSTRTSIHPKRQFECKSWKESQAHPFIYPSIHSFILLSIHSRLYSLADLFIYFFIFNYFHPSFCLHRCIHLSTDSLLHPPPSISSFVHHFQFHHPSAITKVYVEVGTRGSEVSHHSIKKGGLKQATCHWWLITVFWLSDFSDDITSMNNRTI